MTNKQVFFVMFIVLILVALPLSFQQSYSANSGWFSLSRNLTFPATPRFDTISFFDKNLKFFFSGVDSEWKIQSVMQVFNTNSRDWFVLDQHLSAIPGRRDGGAFHQVIQDDPHSSYPEVLMFGGIDAQKQYISKILAVNLMDGTMDEIGNFRRQRFSLLELQDVVLIIGGRTISQSSYLTDVHNTLKEELCREIIVIPKNSSKEVDTWKVVTADELPAREWAAVSQIGSNAGLLFGGVNENGALNDLYRISYTPHESSLIRVDVLTPQSQVPVPRSGHNMITMNGNAYVIGGESASGNGMNDVWSWNMTTRTFTQVSHESHSMRPFLGAAVFALDQDTFCVYGGVSGWNGATSFSGDVNCMTV